MSRGLQVGNKRGPDIDPALLRKDLSAVELLACLIERRIFARRLWSDLERTACASDDSVRAFDCVGGVETSRVSQRNATIGI